MNRAIASARGAQGFCGDHRYEFAQSMVADGIGVDGLPIRLLQIFHNASAS
jgi:hypothetical protein